MPISKVDENMKRAQMRDAVRTQKFWWRTDIFTVCEESKVWTNDDTNEVLNIHLDQEPEMSELSIDEIMNGIPGTDYQVRR